MVDLSTNGPVLGAAWRRADKVWLVIGLIPVVVWLLDPPQAWPTVTFALEALLHTAPFILFAVLAVGWLKATGAETLLARAFEGPAWRMIVLGAMAGGLSPFCSCEVIPFIAALLAVGAPLAGVMAFWLASPLMDPAMFSITAAELGFGFAVAKTVSAVGLGVLGGGLVWAFSESRVFADPLRVAPKRSCCGSGNGLKGTPEWRFWAHAERRETFRDTVVENGLFLVKWLTLAYLVEALMVEYVPADLIAGVLGGQGLWPIVMGALVGAPAYLNGYAAVPLIGGLMEQGMSPGAAMSFVIAGGVSCIPAAMAVWPLVKPRVFAAYFGMGFAGAVLAGIGWSMVA